LPISIEAHWKQVTNKKWAETGDLATQKDEQLELVLANEVLAETRDLLKQKDEQLGLAIEERVETRDMFMKKDEALARVASKMGEAIKVDPNQLE
jgi:hypothetical protein